jgi:hypothetical protein
VLVWGRQWDELERTLADASAAKQVEENLYVLRGEPLFGPYRTEAAAAALRQRFPWLLPDRGANSRVVLLLGEAADVTAERLQRLATSDGEFQIRPLPFAGPPTSAVWEVRDADVRAVVATGSGNYCDPAWLQRQTVRDAGLATALRDHVAWLTIEGVDDGEDAIPAPNVPLVRRLAGGLCDAKVVAVSAWDTETSEARLVLADSSTAGKLGEERSWDAVFAGSPDLFLEARGAGEETRSAANVLRRRELLAFVKSARASPPDQPHWVQVRLRMGAACEDVWLRVISAKHTGWGNVEFVGEFAARSQIWPEAQPGERAAFDSSDVRDWTTETPAGLTKEPPVVPDP